ncbi:MAG: DUF2147 domain-containing protein [Hyphomicrobiaceae bacterium]|nr:DUF2147 domain-containing protein [Hyphomicrobiaceae bacterium]
MYARIAKLTAALLAATTLLIPTYLSGAEPPTGIWYDHDGRGAIEISTCGDALCGTIVWVRDDIGSKACGQQIIGAAKAVAPKVWDGGWIVDPEMGERFDVELSLRSDGTLNVLGYLGDKTLSANFIWRRAPAGLTPCASPPERLASR